MEDYYKTLKISPNTTMDEIRKSYLNLMKKYHTDLYQGDKTFAEKMSSDINVAYDVLSDPIKKNEYDKKYIRILQPQATSSTFVPPKTKAPKPVKVKQEIKKSITKNHQKKDKARFALNIMILALFFVLIVSIIVLITLV